MMQHHDPLARIQARHVRRLAGSDPAAAAAALAPGATERRLVGLVIAWAAVPALADELRAALLRFSRGTFGPRP